MEFDKFEIVLDTIEGAQTPRSVLDKDGLVSQRLNNGVCPSSIPKFIPKKHFVNFRLNGITLTNIIDYDFNLNYPNNNDLTDLGISFYLGKGSLAEEEMKLIRLTGEKINQNQFQEILEENGYQNDSFDFLEMKKNALNQEDIVLFVCAACGDWGCGIATIKYFKKKDYMVWDFSDWYGNKKANYGKHKYFFEWAAYISEIKKFKAYLENQINAEN